MKNSNHNRICPVEKAGALDSFFRKLLQNPRKILSGYIKPGMTVSDIGCGPGYFTIPASALAGPDGEIIAADLQQGMLDILEKKIKEINTDNIVLRKCSGSSLEISEKSDFILIFYIMHEIKDKDRFFKELREILKPGGRILIAEPVFHVSKNEFRKDMEKMKTFGFSIKKGPGIFFTRTAEASL
ncbi:MAG: class I SAM-dependent methyltransferase [Fibrobacterota bacterium]